MEVDDVSENPPKEQIMDVESEEGELSDDDADVTLSEPLKRPEIPEIRVFCPLESEMKIQNRAGGFITGIDVFGKEEQGRLVERAKRFGLDSSQVNLITEQSLKKLYHSVGVKEGDDQEFSFDSLQMHGTEAMSTQDVFEYFKDYAPTSIEWIDDESCNVLWLDNLSAIRALMGLSKPIKNFIKLREKEPAVVKPAVKIKKEKEDDLNKSDADSDVIMIIDDDDERAVKQSVKVLEEELSSDPEAIDALELDFTIPPGRWRKGNTHPNSDGILLRFCPRKSKSKDNGPQRLPQPVFGMMGLVSKSCKKRIKDGLLIRPKMFQDDMGDERDFVISSDEDDGRNPWGTLAKSWSHIDRSRQPPPPIEDDLYGPPLPPGFPPNLRMPPSMHPPPPPHSILNRVGIRIASERRGVHERLSRRKSRSPSRSPSPSPVISRPKSSVHARLHGKRRRRDDDDSDDSAFSGSESDGESWTRKSKIPRMRMYADEEEKKVKERTKLLARRRLSPLKQQTLSKDSHPERRIDLRDRLGRDGPRHATSSKGDHSHSRHRTEPADRVVRSERTRRHSQPKPKVKSVASSVWSRLARDGNLRIKQESVSESSVSESEQSETSSSGEENLTVTRTMRHEGSDHENSGDESEDESGDYSSDDGESVAHGSRVDLRSKLVGHKPASKNGKYKSAVSCTAKPRSPLRIEIDNDEYYRSLHEEKD